ncbi:MAG: response regulator [Gammaproteobacteria bacterium]|nr:MAG: response regulator [Gammaproteobacteria bacterium]
MSKKILVVDDNITNLLIIEEVLGLDGYDVARYESPVKARDEIDTIKPDIILLDIAMPELDGYELCKWIKEESEFADTPVIFVSAKVSVEDRIKGYEVGCYDYITKPYKTDELLAKIKVACQTVDSRKSLKDEVEDIWQTAMEAMSSAGEFGEILQFLDKTIGCSSYDELAKLLLSVTSSLDLSCSVQFRHSAGINNYRDSGECSPNVCDLMSKAAERGRIFEIGTKLFVNFENITLFVKDMPSDNPEQKGRIKDLLPIMLNGANAKILSIESVIALRKKRMGLKRVIDKTHEALLETQDKMNEQKEMANKLLESLIQEMEAGFMTIDLTLAQEEYMIKVLETKKTEMVNLYEGNLQLDSVFKNIIDALNSVVNDN